MAEMRENKAKRKLERGEVVTAVSGFHTPDIIDFLGPVGFDAVWIENQRVLGVTPRPELKPFFDLQYSELSSDVLQWRPRPDSNR